MRHSGGPRGESGVPPLARGAARPSVTASCACQRKYKIGLHGVYGPTATRSQAATDNQAARGASYSPTGKHNPVTSEGALRLRGVCNHPPECCTPKHPEKHRPLKNKGGPVCPYRTHGTQRTTHVEQRHSHHILCCTRLRRCYLRLAITMCNHGLGSGPRGQMASARHHAGRYTCRRCGSAERRQARRHTFWHYMHGTHACNLTNFILVHHPSFHDHTTSFGGGKTHCMCLMQACECVACSGCEVHPATPGVLQHGHKPAPSARHGVWSALA